MVFRCVTYYAESIAKSSAFVSFAKAFLVTFGVAFALAFGFFLAFGLTSTRLVTASVNCFSSLSAFALRSAVGMYFAWFTALRQSLRFMSCDMSIWFYSQRNCRVDATKDTTMFSQKPNFEGTDSPRLLPKVKHARRIRAREWAMHRDTPAHIPSATPEHGARVLYW